MTLRSPRQHPQNYFLLFTFAFLLCNGVRRVKFALVIELNNRIKKEKKEENPIARYEDHFALEEEAIFSEEIAKTQEENQKASEEEVFFSEEKAKTQ